MFKKSLTYYNIKMILIINLTNIPLGLLKKTFVDLSETLVLLFKQPLEISIGEQLPFRGGVKFQLQISAFLRFISPSKNILAIFSK
jgi:hypothetical protein